MHSCISVRPSSNKVAQLSVFALLAVTLIHIQAAMAQSSSVSVVTEKNVVEPIIVSGSRFEENLNEVPANVKIINREEMENSSSTNIPEVLSQIGGLNVRGTNLGELGLGATVDMGGYGATANSTTLVLVDGQRINPIDSTEPPWASIPIDSIERIETKELIFL